VPAPLVTGVTPYETGFIVVRTYISIVAAVIDMGDGFRGVSYETTGMRLRRGDINRHPYSFDMDVWVPLI
jgi:hypothetical protein